MKTVSALSLTYVIISLFWLLFSLEILCQYAMEEVNNTSKESLESLQIKESLQHK